MKKVSVIIPAYNCNKFIKNCIKSIQKQTYQNFEIIVVNDGSSDNTLEILKDLAKEDFRIKVFSQENGGVSKARNTALMQATGEFITMVDSDDDMPENALKTMIDLMKDDVDIVIGSHMQVRIGKKPYIEKVEEYLKREVDSNFRKIDPKIWFPWAKLLRREVIEKNKILYDENISYGEDHLFNLEFIKKMEGKIVCTSEIVYNYYLIRGGLCAKYYPDMNKLQKYVLYGIEKYFGGSDKFPLEYRKHYTGCYLLGCFDYYISWRSYGEAIKKVKETLDLYSDIMSKEIYEDFFSKKQLEFIREEKINLFIIDYIRHNFKKTIFNEKNIVVNLV